MIIGGNFFKTSTILRVLKWRSRLDTWHLEVTTSTGGLSIPVESEEAADRIINSVEDKSNE